MTLRSEVRVLSWGPDRGNPTSMRQGRGAEFTVRPAGGWVCRRASVRACPEEAVGASWSRTRVKRRKAFLGRASWPPAAMPGTCRAEGVVATRSGRNLNVLSREVCWAPLVGRPEDERTMADGPAEVGGPRSTRRRGNARGARRLERRRAGEGGPGRRNGGAASPADRDSRKPERGHPQEGPGARS